MPLKKNWVTKFLVAGFSIFVLAGCEESPFGFGELGRGELTLHQITIEADSMAFYSEQISLGKSLTLIGGRDSLTEARMLFSFDGLDSISVFDSVKLVLFHYKIDTLHTMRQNKINFNIYPLSTSWSQDGCTWVLADAYTKWQRQGGDYDESQLLGEINIDKDTVFYKLDSTRLSVYRKGFILIPQNDGFVYVGAAQSSSYAPALWGFRDEDTIKFTSDDADVYYGAVNDASIIRPYEPSSRDTLVGAGLAWRVYMHFPVDTLPVLTNVTSAYLTVNYKNFFTPEDTLQFNCYRLSDHFAGRFSDFEPTMWGRSSLEYTEDSLSVTVTELIQLWVEEPDSNFGLLFSHSFLPYNPNPSAASYSQENRIYSLGRITGLPKIVITYTAPPEGRFKGEM